MENEAKKTALRMIPYGLYVLTAANEKGDVAAGTVNWVTQTSFAPPLVVVGVKADSRVHAMIRETSAFALNVLGKGQESLAFKFFKPAHKEGNTISGEPFRVEQTGAPILDSTPAYLECKVVELVEKGDHSVIVGEVKNAGLNKESEGRPDEAILWLKDLGENVFYGG